MNLTDFVSQTGVKQYALGSGGFTSIYVGTYTDVSVA
jgi:hypothetical protein